MSNNVDDKWINVDPRTKKLSLRFRVRGFSSQFYISTGLKDTKRNREIVRTRRGAIATDISLGQFDPSLERYQFRATNQPISLSSQIKSQHDLKQLWDKFTDFKSSQVAKTTILGKYTSIKNIINKAPTHSIEKAAEIRDWLLANYSHHTAWETLKYFSSCCQWSVNSKLITVNPFSDIQIAKPKRNREKDDFLAFTLEQRDLIIQGFEEHPSYSHYAPLVKFLFFTGCRHGEAFALTWADVNDECNRISITKSCNLNAITKGTKNGKRRIFPCQQGSKLQQLLLSIRPEYAPKQQLIFTSKDGYPLRTHTLFRFWNKHRLSNGVKIGVVMELAQKGLIPYLHAYSTRHTFATWAIASGCSPDTVAYWIGDDIQTVLKYYCHPSISARECPDF